MTLPHGNYEFILEEGKVYQITPTKSFNAPRQLHISGTGSVDIRVCINTPTSINDPIMTLATEDTNAVANLYQIVSEPNFIKIEENTAGTRIIILTGFNQPKVIFE